MLPVASRVTTGPPEVFTSLRCFERASWIFRIRVPAHLWLALGVRAVGTTLTQGPADYGSHTTKQPSRLLVDQYPDSNGSGIAVIPLARDIAGDVQPFLLVLLGAVGFVLLIACANVANLRLVRTAGRRTEFSLRAALGPRQAAWSAKFSPRACCLRFAGSTRPVVCSVERTNCPKQSSCGLAARTRDRSRFPCPAVLLSTAAVSLLAGTLFGLGPAIRASGADINEALKEGSRGSGGGRQKIRERCRGR